MLGDDRVQTACIVHHRLHPLYHMGPHHYFGSKLEDARFMVYKDEER